MTKLEEQVIAVATQLGWQKAVTEVSKWAVAHREYMAPELRMMIADLLEKLTQDGPPA